TIRWEIVDGQQRLATVTILVRLLDDAYQAIRETSDDEASSSSDLEATAAHEAMAGRARVAANDLREQVLLHKFRDRDRGTEQWEPRLTLSEIDKAYFRSLIDPDAGAVPP